MQLLRDLIRFDTTNPPGNEADCVAYANQLLIAAGFQTVLLGGHPDRPNLIARLSGRGDAPPLLLHGHVDVVTTAGQKWTHPPFEGTVADGCCCQSARMGHFETEHMGMVMRGVSAP